MKKGLLAVLTILLIAGCAGNQPQKATLIDKRIIYRDLTKPVKPPEQKSDNQKSHINDPASIKALTE